MHMYFEAKVNDDVDGMREISEKIGQKHIEIENIKRKEENL